MEKESGWQAMMNQAIDPGFSSGLRRGEQGSATHLQVPQAQPFSNLLGTGVAQRGVTGRWPAQGLVPKPISDLGAVA